jgi:soluble lytic murein transglycosylase-like protein
MWHIVAFISSLMVSDADAEALRQTAPNDLTLETAREHVGAARFAATIYRVEPEDLLAIAYHESRYTADAITHEPGNRVSCGVMTPRPKRQCSPWELEIVGGYLAGAAHLREWYDVRRNNRIYALNGYAGGASDSQVPGYKTWQVFAWRAAWIRRGLSAEHRIRS